MRQSDNHRKFWTKILWACICVFLIATAGRAQNLGDLHRLEGTETTTYYSEGSKIWAEAMAGRCDRVLAFYRPLLDFVPSVTLLVLSEKDWKGFTDFPVYGMPHYNDAETLIVASQDNPFWKSFIPDMDPLPQELAQQISDTYSDGDRTLTMRGFFDLLAIHELGHAYHGQGGLNMQRMWMGELFANLLLHTYIAEEEPELLPALTVFPEMVVTATPKEGLAYTGLNELETNYELIGQQYPNNYGWYQSRWHRAAGTIYGERGMGTIKKLWTALKEANRPLDDGEFADLLATKVHQSVADVPLKWDD